MSETPGQTPRSIVPRRLGIVLLLILVGVLIGGYIIGLRGRAPGESDRPANRPTEEFSDPPSSTEFNVHQRYRGAFERGEAGPDDLESWLNLLRGWSNLPEWQSVYARVLIENSRFNEVFALAEAALSDETYVAAADAALINGEAERLVPWRAAVSDDVDFPGLVGAQATAPTYRALERALLDAASALETDNQPEGTRSTRNAIGLGEPLLRNRAPLYALIESCPGRPESFDPSLDLLRRSAEADPTDALPQAMLARLLVLKAIALLSLLQPEEALETLAEAKLLGFDRADVLYYETLALEILGDFETAETVASEGVAELEILFLYVHARVLLKLGRVRDAHEAITGWHDVAQQTSNGEVTMGLLAYQAAEQLRQLLVELAVCEGLDTDTDAEPAERGLMVGGDRFRCEFLSELSPFHRWFSTAFEIPQGRSDDDLALALLFQWSGSPDDQAFLVDRRSSHFLGVRRELIRAHLRYLFSVRSGDNDQARTRWSQIERLRSMLLSQ